MGKTTEVFLARIIERMVMQSLHNFFPRIYNLLCYGSLEEVATPSAWENQGGFNKEAIDVDCFGRRRRARVAKTNEGAGTGTIQQDGRSGDRGTVRSIRNGWEPELYLHAKEFCFNPLTISCYYYRHYSLLFA